MPPGVTGADMAIARAALMGLMALMLIPTPFDQSERMQAIEALAKYFATHRIAAVSGAGLAERYRGAMGLVSDMRQAMVLFVSQAEQRINEYVKQESSR